MPSLLQTSTDKRKDVCPFMYLYLLMYRCVHQVSHTETQNMHTSPSQRWAVCSGTTPVTSPGRKLSDTLESHLRLKFTVRKVIKRHKQTERLGSNRCRHHMQPISEYLPLLLLLFSSPPLLLLFSSPPLLLLFSSSSLPLLSSLVLARWRSPPPGHVPSQR